MRCPIVVFDNSDIQCAKDVSAVTNQKPWKLYAQPILEKGIVDHSIIHRLLIEYGTISDQVCLKNTVLYPNQVIKATMTHASLKTANFLDILLLYIFKIYGFLCTLVVI